MLISEIAPRVFADQFGIIDETPTWNSGVFRDLTQNGEAKYIIFILLSLNLNSPRKRRNLTHCQDPVIYIHVCH